MFPIWPKMAFSESTSIEGAKGRALARPDLANARGQSLVTVALVLPIILMFMGLVFDFGHAYIQRREMQNAADAGALAGARQLIFGGDAFTAATEYAVRNGADNATVLVDEGAYSVTVIAQKTIATFMAQVLGVSELTLSARASAIWGSVDRVTSDLFPIAIDWDDFEYYVTYDMYEGSGTANFGWLSWDGCGDVGCLVDWLSPGGWGGGVSIGDWIPGNTGVSSAAAIVDALNALIGTPIIIVVWDQAAGSGAGGEYRVGGFATFVPEAFNLPQKSISGRFIEWSIPTTSIVPGGGYGARGTKLIE